MRMPHGGGIHAPEHHSESLEALLCHHPGLRVVCPSSPARAYGLLLAAIRDPDPVMFLEPVRLYRFARQEVQDDGQALPIGCCFVLREGSDVTIVTWGAMTVDDSQSCRTAGRRRRQLRGHRCRHARSDRFRYHPRLGGQDRTAADRARSRRATAASVPRSPRRSTEQALYDLLSPIRRVTGYDTIMPLYRLEHDYIPGVARIVDAIRATLAE